MADDETGEDRAEAAPSRQFLALSLRDGLDAEGVYHRLAASDRGNSVLSQPTRPIDREQRNLDRFLRALRTGQNAAIGYLPPREALSLPVLIPAQVWDHPRIDLETAEVQGAGFRFVDVRVLMSALVFDTNLLSYLHQPVPMLAPFPPSDDQRLRLGIPGAPALPMAASDGDTETRRSAGRPTLRDDILAAFEAIETDPNWTGKDLAHAVRARVKAQTGRPGDKGLGDAVILKHLRSRWHSFRRPRP